MRGQIEVSVMRAATIDITIRPNYSTSLIMGFEDFDVCILNYALITKESSFSCFFSKFPFLHTL